MSWEGGAQEYLVSGMRHAQDAYMGGRERGTRDACVCVNVHVCAHISVCVYQPPVVCNNQQNASIII